MADGRLRVGLIGLGTIHEGHVRGLLQAPDVCRIAAVCYVDADLARRRAGDLGARAFGDHLELLRSGEVDVTCVLLPHSLHHPVVRDALEHGVHTLVEKPMAATAAQARELIDLAADRGLRFTVAENTRFVAAYRRAAEVVASGAIGEPRLVRTLICGSEVERLSRTDLWKGRRDGSVGGAILDAGPHSFYLVEWLAGPIAELWASTAKLVEVSEVEDYGIVCGRLAGGGCMTCEFTFTATIPWSERLELYGAEGSLIVDQLADPPAVLFRGARADGERIEGVPFDPRDWKRRSIADGVEDFVRALAEDRPPAVDPESGWRTVSLVERAYATVPGVGEVAAAV